MLPNIPFLRRLILINFVSPAQPFRNDSYPGDIARDMLTWCLHLEFVDISILTTSGAQHFRRFSRADMGGVEMSGSITDPETVFAWKRESRFDGAVGRMEVALNMSTATAHPVL